MIEEQIASDATVQAVIDWVNRPDTAATWDNTVLIVTADHDHLLYGPQGDTVPFQPLQDNGPGVVPGNKWFGPNHGNGLVPLYAYGKSAAQLVALATHNDSYTAPGGATYGHGAFIDQTEIGDVLKATAAQP
jgi:alkaline phosphatase